MSESEIWAAWFHVAVFVFVVCWIYKCICILIDFLGRYGHKD